MKDLTLLSASYNTPEVTKTMLQSFFFHHPYQVKVLISENSTNDSTVKILKENNINFLRNKKMLHGPAVNLLLENCKTEYALLVDTDIIFLKNHQDIFEQFKENNLTLLGEICGDRGGKKLHKRVHPWHCFINVENIRKNKIKFYDKERQSVVHDVGYDIGSMFFEDIHKNKLKIGDVNLNNDYYRHYEGMSWRTLKFNKNMPDGNIDINEDATHDNQNLYLYGKHIEETYQSEIAKYSEVKIYAG
jgi:hypothetical protein